MIFEIKYWEKIFCAKNKNSKWFFENIFSWIFYNILLWSKFGKFQKNWKKEFSQKISPNFRITTIDSVQKFVLFWKWWYDLAKTIGKNWHISFLIIKIIFFLLIFLNLLFWIQKTCHIIVLLYTALFLNIDGKGNFALRNGD